MHEVYAAQPMLCRSSTGEWLSGAMWYTKMDGALSRQAPPHPSLHALIRCGDVLAGIGEDGQRSSRRRRPNVLVPRRQRQV